MTNPICRLPWCVTDHGGPVHDDTHWTHPETLDTLGQHTPLLTTQVRVQGSLLARRTATGEGARRYPARRRRPVARGTRDDTRPGAAPVRVGRSRRRARARGGEPVSAARLWLAIATVSLLCVWTILTVAFTR
jgi:hypothetical protein